MRLDGLSLGYRSPYLFRLRPTFREMRAGLEERLAERTRIAQDLHDTVLQGILSAAMQLRVAVDQLPANSPAKLRLSCVLELDSQVCANRRKELAPDSEFGAAPRPEQKSSCPSLIPTPSNVE